MYLKSLELKGFKSFADRSVLTFKPNISAIVGPNGSGKSNISDAVLWVLGERNAKNLRGNVMEDVIFAGSSARKSVSFAEVSLVLDNSKGELPVEYDEVEITRRLYRSGDSEYLINKSAARRLDVLDILHDSGLGTETHSIISQGNLDAILQSKPEDRRALIEEAAGVLKHKQRLVKSTVKLERMEQYVLRVNDIVSEIFRSLAPLERKAKRALMYKELSAELSHAKRLLYVDDLKRLQHKMLELENQEQDFIHLVEQKRIEALEAQAALDKLQETLREKSVNATENARLVNRVSACAERINGLILMLQERNRHASKRMEELLGTVAECNRNRQKNLDELRSAQSQTKDLEDAYSNAQNDIEKASYNHTKVQKRLACLDEELSRHMDDRQSLEKRLNEVRDQLSFAQDELMRGQSKIHILETQKNEYDLHLKNAQELLDDALNFESETSTDLKNCETDLHKAEENVLHHFKELQDLRAALGCAQTEVNDAEAAMAGIAEIRRVFSANAGEARSYLLGDDEGRRHQVAALARELRVDSGFEFLVDHLLGSDTTALLVDDASRAQVLVSELREGIYEGEVSLLFRSDEAPVHISSRFKKSPDKKNAPPYERLLSHLRYEKPVEEAVLALLGDVYICQSLGEALIAHKADETGYRFATREGCIVWPEGKITFACPECSGDADIFTQERNYDQACLRYENAKTAFISLQERFNTAEKNYDASHANSLDLKGKIALLRGRCTAAHEAVERANAQLASLEQEQAQNLLDYTEATQVVEQSRPRIDDLSETITTLDETLGHVCERIENVQKELVPARAEETKLLGAVSEASVLADSFLQRQKFTMRLVEESRLKLDQCDQAENTARSLAIHNSVLLSRLSPLIDVLNSIALCARKHLSFFESTMDATEELLFDRQTEITQLQSVARCAREDLEKVSDELSSIRVEKGRLELRVESLVESICNISDLSLESALSLPDVSDRESLEHSVGQLERRISRLGSINPDAASEYEELKTRYDYLVSQLADLRSARSSLAKIDHVIDVRMKDAFLTTFETVNENFQTIFSILFPGGTAELSLTDPDDLGNTGVEVRAQPKGKRITKMTLMSGGEKSFVALALLFAVNKTLATPFYILDEVEAALDDINLRRLIAYLDTIRGSTQLILITHQRATMEMANALFGVSMQSDGISKVISQQIGNSNNG